MLGCRLQPGAPSSPSDPCLRGAGSDTGSSLAPLPSHPTPSSQGHPSPLGAWSHPRLWSNPDLGLDCLQRTGHPVSLTAVLFPPGISILVTRFLAFAEALVHLHLRSLLGPHWSSLSSALLSPVLLSLPELEAIPRIFFSPSLCVFIIYLLLSQLG